MRIGKEFMITSWARTGSLYEHLQQRVKTVRHCCQGDYSGRVQSREPEPPAQTLWGVQAFHQYHPAAGVLPRKTR